MSDELESPKAMYLLGQIHGLVQGLQKGQEVTNKTIEGLQGSMQTSMKQLEDRIDSRVKSVEASVEGLDGRLRAVEQKAAVIGAASGGAMALGTALIVEGLKYWLGRGTPGP